MKDLLTILTLTVLLSVNSHAHKSIDSLKHNIEDKALKLTIDLGNIDKLSNELILRQISAYTKNFLKNTEASRYNIIIKASTSPKKNHYELKDISFTVDIKGTLSEVKKELETIDAVIVDLRKSSQETTF
ncbi:MAG: hypothetical protein EOO44_20225 [Flavobacterium sp.]|nr:MAG: hypothetical protein EOO44_20225 [Flavobacterium sp.]